MTQYIEQSAITPLSNSRTQSVDGPAFGWLGRHYDQQKVRLCGLWNSYHVDTQYEPAFLDELARLVERVRPES